MSEPPAEIEALDQRTIREIAAGEVVERPASVVKELVENALDADAERIAVTVGNGGIDRIRVRDTGHGIPAEQLPTAVAEHTTSKLTDGLAGIDSLGFRGEALYSIGAVARLTLRSRPPEADTGAAITVDHGDRGDARRVGCPVGTTVEVTELFAETPARRKFLAEPTTEFDHVNRVVSAYALANPGVAVSLEHDGRELFATPGDGDVRSAALAVYGRSVAESLVAVGEREQATDPERDEVAVGGVVSDPETTRASREYVTTFVNGRWVRDSDLRSAVVDAYGGQVAADRAPFAVLFVTVPPETVDANVHPRKTEVRFDDEARVYETVRETVREGLLDAGLIRGSAPRGRSAPDEATLDPEVVGGAGTDHERVADERRPADENPAGAGAEHATADENPADAGAEHGTADETTTGTGAEHGTADETRGADTHASTVLDAWGSTAPTPDPAETDPTETTSVDSPEPESGDRDSPDPHAASEEPTTRPTPRDWQSTDGVRLPTQTTLDGDRPEGPETESLPSLRVMGQYDDTYLVCETDDGLVLIDQHAADERVNYERLRAAADDGTTQTLVEPVEIPVTAREAALFDRLRDGLSAAGFVAERHDDRTLRVTGVPAVFDAALDPSLLRDVLTAAAESVSREDPVAAAADALLADLACYPSITGHTSLTEGTASELLAALDDCENPYACPHGRPVIVRFDHREIRDRFERDYPGHPEGGV